MDQSERLDLLVERFKEDSVRYKDLDAGDSTEEKRRTLRSLMNIRMPYPMDDETLKLQDEYLKQRNLERGIVGLDDIPTIAQQGSRMENGQVISLWQGDITRLACDAIVNAANSQMLGCFVPMHTCIDNCIHTYAGVQLRAECDRQMRALRREYGEDYEQPTSVPMLTGGYALPAKHVIHVVGPIVNFAVTKELERDLLDMCLASGLRSVAFCCISTGVFHFPQERAAKLAVKTTSAWLAKHPGALDRVIFNVFNDRDLAIYRGLLGV